jgi:hypothetical protein
MTKPPAPAATARASRPAAGGRLAVAADADNALDARDSREDKDRDAKEGDRDEQQRLGGGTDAQPLERALVKARTEYLISAATTALAAALQYNAGAALGAWSVLSIPSAMSTPAHLSFMMNSKLAMCATRVALPRYGNKAICSCRFVSHSPLARAHLVELSTHVKVAVWPPSSLLDFRLTDPTPNVWVAMPMKHCQLFRAAQSPNRAWIIQSPSL